MLEYAISLDPEVEEALNNNIEQLNKITGVKKMNRILNRCQELVMRLRFRDSDPHHKHLKEQILKFGISPQPNGGRLEGPQAGVGLQVQ